MQTLSPLKTIHAIMCTFFFSQLLQEQQQRQLECKHRDGFLIIFAKTKQYLSLLLQLRGTPAKSNSMHTPSITHPSLQTLNASQLFCLKLKNTLCLPLAAPLPSLNEHSRFLNGFCSGYINDILDYNTICCAREKQLLKLQSLIQSIISSLIHVLLEWPIWLCNIFLWLLDII